MNNKENDTMQSALEFVAQCWCDAETSNIQMDDKLAKAFAKRLAEMDDKLANEFETRLADKMNSINQLEQKIQKLIAAGDVMYKLIEPPSISMRTSTVDNALQGWDDAKNK